MNFIDRVYNIAYPRARGRRAPIWFLPVWSVLALMTVSVFVVIPFSYESASFWSHVGHGLIGVVFFAFAAREVVIAAIVEVFSDD